MSMLVLLPLVMMIVLIVSPVPTAFVSPVPSFTLENWGVRSDRPIGPSRGIDELVPVRRLRPPSSSSSLGYPMAYILARSSFANKFVILVLTIIPMWSNSLLRNNALRNLFLSQNIVNDLLQPLGLSFAWNHHRSRNRRRHRLGLDVFAVHGPARFTPVLEKMDKSLLEASMDLGANKIRTFFKVTFPLVDQRRRHRRTSWSSCRPSPVSRFPTSWAKARSSSSAAIIETSPTITTSTSSARSPFVLGRLSSSLLIFTCEQGR
ncbi:MAG: hypothetical protein MZU97_00665 [Bacillus subtilis]|nr:hypothetical protein [Bacillus subtilis]